MLMSIGTVGGFIWVVDHFLGPPGLSFSPSELARTANAASASPSHSGHRNHLSEEKSPYLLQHAENPIWWYPWGSEALEAAQRENKPIFLSIGYSSCYWCHFMEKDSFEKEDVAAVLNSDFISIKVDREERPDVDNIYMTALLAVRGSGGWPITMFLTPEGIPFWGTSTMQREQFKSVSGQIAELWKSNPEKIRAGADELASALNQHLYPDMPPEEVGQKELARFLKDSKSAYDPEFGGFGGAPKFPQPAILRALLLGHERSGDPKSLKIVDHTLKALARGGIHDLLGGGFHRYSVDREWNIPHFEKMLYDNAGLVLAYAQAYEISKDPEYLLVVRKTLDWVLDEMTHPQGGFYSARDAGEYEEEGDFYAWKHDELKSLLTAKEFAYATKRFQLTESGNFEGSRNVFHVPIELAIPDPSSDADFRSIQKKLLAARNKREAPRLDDKVLTAWNGLMIGAMAQGYRASKDERYLDAARASAHFIQENLTRKDGGLQRRWRDGDAYMGGVMNDYAFLIFGLIELYEADGDTIWIDRAVALQERQTELFWDDNYGGYFFDNNEDGTLKFRSKEYRDGAMPTGNSVAAYNLLRLGELTGRQDLSGRGREVIRSAGAMIKRSPFAMAQMIVALDYAITSANHR